MAVSRTKEARNKWGEIRTDVLLACRDLSCLLLIFTAFLSPSTTQIRTNALAGGTLINDEEEKGGRFERGSRKAQEIYGKYSQLTG